jgi:predicted DNA-binding protein
MQVVFNSRLELEIAQKLEAYCAKAGKTKVGVVNLALERFFAELEKDEREEREKYES